MDDSEKERLSQAALRMAQAAEQAVPGIGFVLFVFHEGAANFAANVQSSPRLFDQCRQMIAMMERQRAH